ncbi:MAG: Hsp20 family protein [Rhodospirillaceae bacterium]|nr:Hsp20 family protein [Rhodospirillaceae bacterium]MCA8934509.1 Hsp20 family protein [Rhodospirillaceae bacterium]
MRTFDLTPLFRSTVGFDRMSRLLDSALNLDDSALAYPPYNIEKRGENEYRITMAVAGFSEADIEVTQHENTLIVKGRLQAPEEGGTFLYRGIAGRAFERRFQLADYIRVGSASLVNGLLHVDMVREVPEALKPRTIAIETEAVATAPKIEQKAA